MSDPVSTDQDLKEAVDTLEQAVKELQQRLAEEDDTAQRAHLASGIQEAG